MLLSATSGTMLIFVNLESESVKILDKFTLQAKDSLDKFADSDMFFEIIGTKILHLEESFRGPQLRVRLNLE